MIWVIAGTAEAREIVYRAIDEGYSVIASVVTDYGKELFKAHERLTVLCESMDTERMAEVMREYKVTTVIDASHPYADQVSRNAIAAADEVRIPYLRFERERVDCPGAVSFSSYDECAYYLKNKTGNIFLTIGSKNLSYFSSGNFSGRIFARVLPQKSSLDACEKAGIKPDKIIAMKFPFSIDLNKALFKELGIKYIVTKESGKEGGINEKISVAQELGIEVIIIKRPEIDYPNMSSNIKSILAGLDKIHSSGNKG